MDYITQRIEERYNPERDCPDVEVSWVDISLLDLIKQLRGEVKQLREELKELKAINKVSK